jgi:CubicO group peptidase (beta-lactamase class C family)
MKFTLRTFGILVLLAAIAAALTMARQPLRIATGSVAHGLCAAAFVSHVDPWRAYDRQERRLIGALASIISIDLDRRGAVTASMLGLFAQRAVFKGPSGCVLVDGSDVLVEQALPRTQVEDSDVIIPADPNIAAALRDAFAEPDPAHPRNTLAMLVMHKGKIVGEQYADGYGPHTPIWVHSVTKSVAHALIGILIGEHRLSLDQQIPMTTPERAIAHVSIDQLLRMSSGLPFDETAQVTNPMTRMFFLERDMAQFASNTALVAAPGHEWAYSNLGYVLLGRMIRDANQDPRLSTAHFIARELFAPLGMHDSLLETDAVGTPITASHLFASARDLARFGQLYLQDGVIDGHRLLPEGWVQHARTPTLNTGYGAGFWLNRLRSGNVPEWNAPWGMPSLPEDMFYARGAFGQYVVIIPSRELVVVRLGFTPDYRTGLEPIIGRLLQILPDS